VSELGLFPLGIVLLPTEQVPLHIFEERYRELIGECLAEEREFGLVYADEEGIRDVGTLAAVIEVLDRFEDGRLNILVEGGERFRLLALTSGRSFPTGQVEPVEDEDDPAEPESIDEALSLFGRLRTEAGSEVAAPPADAPQLSYALAARVELPVQVKLELLAELSERARLARVRELLEGALVALRTQRAAARQAAGNGRVQLG
jgi:Lon protease-like protein